MKDELSKAKTLVDKAPMAEAKERGEDFLDSIITKSGGIVKARTAHRKLSVKRGKEVNSKLRALKKCWILVDSQNFVPSKLLFRCQAPPFYWACQVAVGY